MAEPVICPGFFGDVCNICVADVWQNLTQATEILCTFSDLVSCPGAPATYDGEFILTQVGIAPCLYLFQDPNGFISFLVLEPPEQSHLIAWKDGVPNDFQMFEDVPNICETSFTNDLVVAQCGDPTAGGVIGGHGGTAEIRVITPAYMPHRFICQLEMDPPDDQFWNEHSVDGTKYNFSIYSRRYSNQLQVQIDTDEI
jgi:hypothetical protein